MKNMYDYSQVVKKMRDFFQGEKGFIEVPAQSRQSILAACEDPATISQYIFSGVNWPLPQTGQMWLERDLLDNPKVKGVFCITTSYRNEPNPVEGRHDKIFPMFEFESHGNMDDMIKLEKELLTHLGFGTGHKSITYDDACDLYKVSELDYEGIRSNLKTFLQNQAEFSDYDFEGSGMSVLLDLLAYNTHYLSFNANMLSNELYLDSADIRKNVVALAKQLGYTPTSVSSPQAIVDITVNNVPSGTASITMAKGTSFVTSIDGINYVFITNEAVTMQPTDGVYKFENVKIYEGTAFTFQYTVDSSDVDQKFIILPSVTDLPKTPSPK